MYMSLKLGDSNEEFQVTSCNVSLYSRGDSENIDDCEPGEIQLTVKVELPKKKVKEGLGGGIYKFAETQDATASAKRTGTISIYASLGKEGKATTDAVQTVSFSHAWIANLHSSFSEGTEYQSISMTIYPSALTISGKEYVNFARKKISEARS